LTNSKKIIFGNNEDNSFRTSTRIWFIPRGENFYGCMYVGYDNGWGQGGLNEKGLAYDWVSGYLSDYSPSPHLQKTRGNPSERMLETCATVDEAIIFYQKYQELSFSHAKLFIADSTGNSVIIQANNGKLEFLTSNKSRVLGYGEQTFNRMLSENSSVELSNAKNILSCCIQTGESSTMYSTIYDLKTKDIYVYSYADFENVSILNLEDELKKGEHYYEISQIKEQLFQQLKPILPNMKRLYSYSEPMKEQDVVINQLVTQLINMACQGDLKQEMFSDNVWSEIKSYLPLIQNVFTNFRQIKSLYAIKKINDNDKEEYHYVVIFEEERILLEISFQSNKIVSLQFSI